MFGFKHVPHDKIFFLKKLQFLHFGVIALILLISCIGFIILYSAAGGSFDPWSMRQIIRFLICFPMMLLIAITDIRFFVRYAYVFYGIAFVMLVLVEITGHTAMGATRWLRIGPINVQPSEIMKITLILALARYFHGRTPEEIGRIPTLIVPLLMLVIPVVLILKQPNLGTALITTMIAGAIFFGAGVRAWKFLVLIFSGLASLPVIWQFMQPYQKTRVMTFLNPETDPLGDGYNVLQSKIAIGSGGPFGKGFLNGSQSQLSFLPEHQTDFIFTMFTEEFGFVGGVSLLMLYALLIFLCYHIGIRCQNVYGRLVSIGVATMLFVHLFINMGMNMGLLPVVGTPLPLLSYGGTIMISMLIGFGFLLNAYIHRHAHLMRAGD